MRILGPGRGPAIFPWDPAGGGWEFTGKVTKLNDLQENFHLRLRKKAGRSPFPQLEEGGLRRGSQVTPTAPIEIRILRGVGEAWESDPRTSRVRIFDPDPRRPGLTQ